MTPPLAEVRRYTERRPFSGTKQGSNRLCCGMTNRELRWEVAVPLLAADPVTVLPEQREVLEQLVRTHSTPQQLAMRARLILCAADDVGVRESARELDVWPKTVRYWRKRWRQAADGQSVPERLADAPRSGAPATYTPEQICAVVAMTCEKPSDSERPISHWSQREIADEAMRRGVVRSISQRSVGRFLKKRPTSNRIASVTG
jgi:putative transposase